MVDSNGKYPFYVLRHPWGRARTGKLAYSFYMTLRLYPVLSHFHLQKQYLLVLLSFLG